MIYTSVCIRCGKTRVVSKTWKEKTSGAEITYTETVCPDKDCQKIVDEQLTAKKEKIAKIQKESLARRAKNTKGRRRKTKR